MSERAHAFHCTPRLSAASSGRFVTRHPVIFVLAATVSVLLFVALHHLESREAHAGERRMGLRADMATRFVQSYVEDLIDNQRSTARAYLGGESLPPTEFARLVGAHDYQGAVLLDASGRVRAAYPTRPGLVGRSLREGYDHLDDAMRGEVSISNVVPSAARALPIVAIATPFETRTGRRVFSTAYEVGGSPLTSYLASAMPTTADDVYLVDAKGDIVASERRQSTVVRLQDRDPQLRAAIAGEPSGILPAGSAGEEERFYTQRHVAGTPWRLVATAPRVTVHASADPARHRARLGFVALLGAAVMLIAVLFARLVEARARLLEDLDRRMQVEAELVRERGLLAHQARHDSLTGLPNRALLFDRLERIQGILGGDQGLSAAMLFVDLDRFKVINDSYGHEAGDRVLQAIADRLSDVVRPDDTVARLGGDEFAVLCENMDADEGAGAIASRIREALERPIEIGPGRTVTVGASIGIAHCHDSSTPPDRLLAEADAAMYEAKARGRAIGSAGAAVEIRA